MRNEGMELKESLFGGNSLIPYESHQAELLADAP